MIKLKEPINYNYAAIVVQLKDFNNLPNCDNVKAAIINFKQVIVSKDYNSGDLGLFFPVECQLSPEFLSNNNLYRKHEFGNKYLDKPPGFFEQAGRIKCIKFRGHSSEGFYIPLSFLNYLNINLNDLKVGDTFDNLNGNAICKKYIIKQNNSNSNLNNKQPLKQNLIVDNQFRFHFDTKQLSNNIYKINGNTYISISRKYHGTSVVISNLLVKNNLNILEKFIDKFFNYSPKSSYRLISSSRKVIKQINGITKLGKSFYSQDIYTIVAEEIKDIIPAGFSIYWGNCRIFT